MALTISNLSIKLEDPTRSEPIMSLQTFGFNSILGGGGWSSEFQCPIVQFSQVPPVNGGGCHNWEKNFIDFLHVSQHIDHF